MKMSPGWERSEVSDGAFGRLVFPTISVLAEWSKKIARLLRDSRVGSAAWTRRLALGRVRRHHPREKFAPPDAVIYGIYENPARVIAPG